MNKREQILEHIRVAGYDDDMKTAMRLYVENRVSYDAFQKAFAIGGKQRKANTQEKKQ